MICYVIKNKGIAHLPLLSFKISHVSVPLQLCLGGSDLYAAFQLDFLCTWQYCLWEWLCPFASPVLHCLLKTKNYQTMPNLILLHLFSISKVKDLMST